MTVATLSREKRNRQRQINMCNFSAYETQLCLVYFFMKTDPHPSSPINSRTIASHNESTIFLWSKHGLTKTDHKLRTLIGL